MKAKQYFYYLISRHKLRKFLRKIFFLYPIARKLKGVMLDVGCGIGEFLEVYRRAIGIDSNPYNVNYCKAHGLKVMLGSVYSLSFKKGVFDGVVLLNIIEHLHRPQKAIREIKEVLKCKGKLFITTPTKAGFKRDKTHVKFWSKKELCEFLTENNFKIERVFYYPIPIFKDLFWFNELRIICTKN